jgi:hypothetical protein
MVATGGLLSYLGFKAIRKYMTSPHKSSISEDINTQGFFWLINLFIAGITKPTM